MARTETFNRDQVLFNILETFWSKGYNGTSMQDLVDATGLNRSSLYNSFGDKKSLYKTALKIYMERSGRQLEHAIKKSNNTLEGIEFMFYSFLPEIKVDSRGCMNMKCKAEMSGDESMANWLTTSQKDILNLFEDLVIAGQGSGHINKDQQPQVYAWYLYNAFQGFRMTGILEKDETILKSIVKNTLSVLK